MTKQEFLQADAARYVDTLESELTPAAAQNAYHALVRLHAAGADIAHLKARYETAVDTVNDRFPC